MERHPTTVFTRATQAMRGLASRARSRLGFILLATLVSANAQAVVIPIDPTATYLRTVSDGSGPATQANDAVAITLSDHGFSAGDTVRMTTLGSFNFRLGQASDCCGDRTAAVFSSSAVLLANPNQGDPLESVPNSDAPNPARNRVQDAIDAGPDFVTARSFFPAAGPFNPYDGFSTDIQQDFLVPTLSVGGITLVIPTGATHLFVTPDDSLFHDNTDDVRIHAGGLQEFDDYAIEIVAVTGSGGGNNTTVSEPGSLAALCAGLVLLGWRRRAEG